MSDISEATGDTDIAAAALTPQEVEVLREIAGVELAKREAQRAKDAHNEAIRAAQREKWGRPTQYAQISTPMPDYILPRPRGRVIGYRREAGSAAMVPIYYED